MHAHSEITLSLRDEVAHGDCVGLLLSHCISAQSEQAASRPLLPALSQQSGSTHLDRIITAAAHDIEHNCVAVCHLSKVYPADIFPV